MSARTFSDEAYGRSNHFEPIHTEEKLFIMAYDERLTGTRLWQETQIGTWDMGLRSILLMIK